MLRTGIIVLFILVCTVCCSYGQANQLTLVSPTAHEKNVARIYDSLQIPLLIYKNKIYAIHSDCITRDLGGNKNDRDSGGNSTDRGAGGNASDRNAGGNANDRNADGTSNTRNAGADSNDRNSGGAGNDRNSGGSVGDRNDGGNRADRNASGNSGDRSMDGVISKITCGIDDKGKLVIFFHNMEPDRSTRVYYNNSYLTLKNNFFKLKKL
jgi:hypothetical protein